MRIRNRLFPSLANQIFAEAVMRLLLDEAKASFLVNSPRGVQNTVRPKSYAFVAGGPSEAHALLYQMASQTETPRRRFDQKQAELRKVIGFVHQKHRANAAAIPFRDPAGFPLRIEVPEELSGNLGDERLEGVVPPVFLCIQNAVPFSHPSHIACPLWPEHEGRGFGCALAKQGFDAFQRLDQLFLIGYGKLRELRAGFFVGSLVEGGELRSAFGGERKDMPPPICLRDIPRYQAPLTKTGDDPADVAGIQAELLAKLIRGRAAQVRNFVKDAGFGK
jgi:hypothetical protein